ncbi:hypothetical protein LTR86_008076 [Recurvomyces mirabilis]|nr:hypothetical protein LTR86_008076 [Recurvomyces mirabilis]
MFGGAPGGFDVGDKSVVAVTTDYCFNVVLKSTLSTEQLPSWFLAFSQNPIVYNCMSYAVGVYQESTGIATPKVEQQTLVHKGRTIHLVNQALPDLQQADLEAVMLGIFVLWRCNFTKASPHETLLFRPYIPEANLITEFGKFDAIDAHANALHWLIDKAGGIDNIKLPGLKLILSNGDLLESTARCTKPRLPCMWEDHFATLDNLLPSPSSTVLATGFSRSVPGGLPELAKTTLERMKKLDLLLDMSHHRRLDDALFTSLMATRNTIQHEILALPKWQELNEEERQGSQFATYETCRITALMYANAVLFPMPPSTGWHLKLLDELRQLLQMTNLVAWRQDTSALLTWSLTIASIAAFRTVHRRYFRDTLKTVLLEAQVKTWSAMESRLKLFLWTNSACGIGGDVLWESLGMDGFG